LRTCTAIFRAKALIGHGAPASGADEEPSVPGALLADPGTPVTQPRIGKLLLGLLALADA